jgi:hypothetical protein
MTVMSANADARPSTAEKQRAIIHPTAIPLRIVSGGQTGPDRAALDFALEHGLAHGGWCPRGRLAEDGILDARYHLSETPSSDPIQRTEWNVRDSDGTVIFSMGKQLAGGSKQTAEFARRYKKPCLHLNQGEDSDPARRLLTFLALHKISTLNVAGPRRSEEPGAQKFAFETLSRLWRMTAMK